MHARKMPGVILLSIFASCLAFAESQTGRPQPNSAISPGRKPDLKVHVELRKEQRNGKWYVRMRFNVMNVGAGPAGPSTLGSYCKATVGGPCPALDGAYDMGPPVEAGATGVVRLATPAIPAGGAVFVFGPNTKEWPNGSYVIHATADVRAVEAETIEANNNGQAAINVP